VAAIAHGQESGADLAATSYHWDRMTLSKDDRRNNEDLALRQMLQELPANRPYEWELLDGGKEPFLTVYPTTWKELVRRGLVKEWTFNRYRLTGHGWISALKVSGKFDSQELRENAGKLSAALKKRVEGRRADGSVTRGELQNETGLSEGFIYNAIDSHLLYHLFNCHDAHWAADDEMKNYIEVPLEFCLPAD
jgi:hypothetical protein